MGAAPAENYAEMSNAATGPPGEMQLIKIPKLEVAARKEPLLAGYCCRVDRLVTNAISVCGTGECETPEAPRRRP